MLHADSSCPRDESACNMRVNMTRNIRRYDYSSLYHVISRGNNKGQIFFHDDDLKKFFGLLKEMAAEYSFKIHLYCLMDNHFHLVIEIGPIPLKPLVVQSEQYLLELCYYIHMNPIKAHLVDELDQYAWSSHLVYREKRKEDWVTIHQLRSASLNRELMFGRSMIGYFAHYHGMHYMKDIGEYLNRHPDSVGRAMRHAFAYSKICKKM